MFFIGEKYGKDTSVMYAAETSRAVYSMIVGSVIFLNARYVICMTEDQFLRALRTRLLCHERRNKGALSGELFTLAYCFAGILRRSGS
jgi:hypothetical protein